MLFPSWKKIGWGLGVMGRRRDRAQRSCAGPAGLSRGVNLVTICVKRKPKELLWTLPQSECFALKKKKKKENTEQMENITKKNKIVFIEMFPRFLKTSQVMIYLPEMQTVSCHFTNTAASFCKDGRTRGRKIRIKNESGCLDTPCQLCKMPTLANSINIKLCFLDLISLKMSDCPGWKAQR